MEEAAGRILLDKTELSSLSLRALCPSTTLSKSDPYVTLFLYLDGSMLSYELTVDIDPSYEWYTTVRGVVTNLMSQPICACIDCRTILSK